jgi:hypothetical protein
VDNDDAMTQDTLDGYLHAVAIGPQTTKASMKTTSENLKRPMAGPTTLSNELIDQRLAGYGGVVSRHFVKTSKDSLSIEMEPQFLCKFHVHSSDSFCSLCI